MLYSRNDNDRNRRHCADLNHILGTAPCRLSSVACVACHKMRLFKIELGWQARLHQPPTTPCQSAQWPWAVSVLGYKSPYENISHIYDLQPTKRLPIGSQLTLRCVTFVSFYWEFFKTHFFVCFFFDHAKFVAVTPKYIPIYIYTHIIKRV